MPAWHVVAFALLSAGQCEGPVRKNAVPQQLCDARLLSAKGCPIVEQGLDWAAFLSLACKHCPVGQPCAPRPISDDLILLADRALRLPEVKCGIGAISAIIVMVQFARVESTQEADTLRISNWSLAPFPFYTLQHSLYANMVPVKDAMCDESLATLADGRLVPRVLPEALASCGMTYTDAQLVRRCRSRRARPLVLAQPLAMLDAAQRPPGRIRVRCPRSGAVGFDSSMRKNLEVYQGRAQANKCQTSQGMWQDTPSSVHRCVLVTIGHFLNFMPGQRVLDWGSGCGHALSWAKMFFDVNGLGVEAIGAAVQWANKHSLGTFCRADGRTLDWIPNQAFDHVISYGALYHLSKPEQCSTVWQLIQKLRIGGRAWLGWNRVTAMSNWEWRICLFPAWAQDAGTAYTVPKAWADGVRVDMEDMEDAFLFASDEDVGSSMFAYRYPAYSLFLTRRA